MERRMPDEFLRYIERGTRGIIRQLQQKKGDTENLLNRLQQELSVHMNGEEQLFYSLLLKAEQYEEMKRQQMAAAR